MPADTDDFQLALAHAPVLRFDRAEPFLPSRVGFNVFRQPADSGVDYRRTLNGPAPLRFDVSGVAMVLEYGIWWDWEIQHLYELEATWVYLDARGDVLRVEASWHGQFHEMRAAGQPPVQNGRPVLYSQPGKHAFAPSPDWFTPHEQYTEPCLCRPGVMGLHITPLFQGIIAKQPGDDERVLRHLQALAFTPTFVFDQEFAITEEHLYPWPELKAWIPARVAEVARGLRGEEQAA